MNDHVDDAAVADLGPNDEAGLPADRVEKCDCGVMFEVGGAHRCEDRGEWVEYDEWVSQ